MRDTFIFKLIWRVNVKPFSYFLTSNFLDFKKGDREKVEN